MPMPALATRLRRSLGFRGRLALALLVAIGSGIVWDLLRDRPDPWPVRAEFELPPQNWPLGFGPDGRTFLTAGEGGLVPWDLATGRPGKRWATKSGWIVYSGAWSPDGRTYAAVVSGHPSPSSFDLIDVATGRSTATIKTNHPIVMMASFVDGGRALRAFLGDSAAIKEVATWDVATGQLISTRPIPVPTLGTHYAFSPDARWLATLKRPATVVQLRDLEADRPPISLSDPNRPGLLGSGLGFSPDSRTLAVAREGGFVDLWDVAARKVSRTLAIHSSGYVSSALQFSPDGRTLASTAYQESGPGLALFRLYSDFRRNLIGRGLAERGEEILFDLDTDAKLGQYSSHHIPFFSPDGRSLATSGDYSDQTALVIKVRDLPTPPTEKGNHP